jgi:hypothetical protein
MGAGNVIFRLLCVVPLLRGTPTSQRPAFYCSFEANFYWALIKYPDNELYLKLTYRALGLARSAKVTYNDVSSTETI